MKITLLLSGALMSGLLLLNACSKSEPSAADSVEYYGVKVSSPKLDAEFASASPEIQASVRTIKLGYRYGRFPEALAELEKLAGNPGLNETQKKLVNDLIDQTKQVIAKAGQPAGQ